MRTVAQDGHLDLQLWLDVADPSRRRWPPTAPGDEVICRVMDRYVLRSFGVVVQIDDVICMSNRPCKRHGE